MLTLFIFFGILKCIYSPLYMQYHILAPNHHIRMISEGSFIHIIHIID